ncbi:PREDICTED: 2',5'-phosphodiesterase 12 isoform X1 [Wasmannia auropunctata]|uniref:2',5'-phosphodiesterase 12 isoform X1 n=1 Tax=Wasmannia auropunctata TaxID=64793 RepID=UPI0005EE41FC|nr:PREDICTED: 2',5'-phosphodiesterase 12 isoform X1 [Wasmannia auropunctata]
MLNTFAKLLAHRIHLVSSFLPYRNKHCHPRHILKMNEAFLRYEKGNDMFDISFRYVDEVMKVDRQFNFSRQAAESVNNFLKRIDTNVCKILNRKAERKKKKNAASEVSELTVNNVENGKIMLLKNDTKVDGEILCESLLQDSAELKLIIFEKTFLVKRNAPYIIKISLPSSILAGFPIYPSKFESLYTDMKQSTFDWYKNNPVKLYSWTHVGNGYLYIPSVTDIGCHLKISCEPRNESDSGSRMEVESKNVVEAGPGQCPFDTRHQFTKHKLSGRSFRVISYNVLADTYADSDFSKDVLFPYCPQYALDMDYRKQLILKEIIGFNGDIICLQEVDKSIYEYDLLPSLYMLNYDGVFVTKNEISEGLATFFNQDRFEKLGFEYSVMAQNIDCPKFAAVWSKIVNDKMKERFLSRNTTIQVTTLRSKENQSEILIIGNTHLYFKPDADHIRLLQGYYAVTYIHDVAKRIREENPACNVSVMLCGDFNSVPECGIYQLMTENYVPETCEDWKSNAEEAVENVSLAQDLCMSSACGTPEYTNYTPEFSACLDYIFYEKDKFEVEQVVPMPSKEELTLNTGLPSVVFPSDHISLCADLKLKG